MYTTEWPLLDKGESRFRQLHIYRNGKKVLILAGKAAPKVIREDALCGMLPKKIKG